MASTSTAHAADREYLVRRGASKGYQLASMLSPIVYTVFSLSRYGRQSWGFNRMLRATWAGGALGIAGGGAFEFLRSANSNEENVRARRIKYAYDTDSIRADDHSTIGALLIGVLTPAILWKRAHAIHLILGGAGIGSTAGLLAHWGRSMTGDPPPVALPPPTAAPPVQS